MINRSIAGIKSTNNKFKAQKWWLLLILLLISGCNLETPLLDSSTDEFSTYLDARIPELMNRYDIPGVSIVLVRNGQRVWGKGYGLADLTTGRRITTDTICRVESISKSVTSWGAMKLVQEGRIEIDEPIYRYLKNWGFPESDYDESKITLRMLLTHQAGLPLGPIGIEYSPNEEMPTLKESLTRNAILIQEPGSGFIYSNVGYHLVELLIEEVTGRDFSEYMKSEILEHLDMNRADYDWSESFDPPVPLGYDLKGNPVPVYVYPERGSGGLFASAEDIAHFMMAGMKENTPHSGPLLHHNSIKVIYKPSAKIAGIYAFVSQSYGFGHFIHSLSNGEVSVFSGGQGHGWMTHFQSIPERGDGIVILTNSQRSWPFIGYLVQDWEEWLGYSSFGMARIADAVTGIWIFIGGLFLCSIVWLVRLGTQIRNKHRQFAPLKNTDLWMRSIYLILSFGLIMTVLWTVNQDYFFLFSVFPIASVWLFTAILFIAVLLLISAVFPNSPGKLDPKNEPPSLKRRRH